MKRDLAIVIFFMSLAAILLLINMLLSSCMR
jgi:hypothetical protein